MISKSLPITTDLHVTTYYFTRTQITKHKISNLHKNTDYLTHYTRRTWLRTTSKNWVAVSVSSAAAIPVSKCKRELYEQNRPSVRAKETWRGHVTGHVPPILLRYLDPGLEHEAV
jgi:hypothetical protein